MSRRAVSSHGFTLLETLVTLLIVALLASFAVSGYRQYTLETNRAGARAFLLQLAARQLDHFADRKSFAADPADLGYPATVFAIDGRGQALAGQPVSARYRITLSGIPGAPPHYHFRATAIAINTQRHDRNCARLAIDDRGTRSALSAAGQAATDCW